MGLNFPGIAMNLYGQEISAEALFPGHLFGVKTRHRFATNLFVPETEEEAFFPDQKPPTL